MAVKGADFTNRNLTGATLRAHGYLFACRYVKNATGPNHIDKEMTRAEVREKSAAGVRIVSNWELGETPANTAAEGKAHALAFLDVHKDLGGPDWAPCYYSVDHPAGAGSMDQYARGWANTITPERCGCYGDGALFRGLKAAGLITLAWQSKSKSFPGNSNPDGSWNHAGADIIQLVPTSVVGGVTVDNDTAVSAYYGGWLLGEDNPMARTISDDDIAAFWGFDINKAAGQNGELLAREGLRQAWLRTGTIANLQEPAEASAIAALQTSVNALQVSVNAIPTETLPMADFTDEQLAAIAKAVNDELNRRTAP